MIPGILAQFNFLDYMILIILFRICYIAAKMGLSVEIFKLSGVIFSTYIALHYYTTLSNLIQRRFLPKAMPLEFMDFIIFLLLIIAVYLFFVGLRGILFRFIQLNAIPKINQFFGLILGIGRGFLFIGLLSFTLVISSVTYLSSSVKHSYLASKAFAISPQAYNWLWSNIFSKFSTQEKFNSTVTEVMDEFNANEIN
ncbi:MAG: CvpA family protein [Candidatus Omnitrophica bacterium]|nr:CvpA family protein [Candidatus Omnitrophota bacterium]